MEKYSKNIRLILISNTTSNIIAPIKSRTLLIRIPSPTVDDITKVLSKLASKQEIQLPSDEQDKIQVLNNVGASSKRNLRRALLLLEALTMQNETLKTTTPMITLDWEGVIKKLAGNISRDRNVARISSSRTVLYELISHCIPPKIILKTLAFELLNFVNDKVKSDIVELAAIFDERLSLGTKSIFHLEGFIAKSMVAIEKNA